MKREQISPVAPGEATIWSPVVEFRRYALHPGQREVLIELFDSEFLETQEAVGMKVIGQFRVLDDPDSFVWLRGFPDMPSRARALTAFYDGPVWARHRAAANATMIDSDNVLLLRPARRGSGFLLNPGRPPPDGTATPAGLIVATIYYLDDRDLTDLATRLEAELIELGGSILAVFVTETSPSNFPRLPVREDERVVVAFLGFSDEAEYDDYLAGAANRRPQVARSAVRIESLKLQPTARSHKAIPISSRHAP